MAEFLSNAYKELEMESIDRSIARFEATKNQANNEATYDAFEAEDPRVAATEAMAMSVGFSLEAGQYVDIQK